jgi:hypothetical protein
MYRQLQLMVLFGLVPALSLGLSPGYLQQKTKPEKPFFEKWQATADESTGSSPSQKRCEIEVDAVAAADKKQRVPDE